MISPLWRNALAGLGALLLGLGFARFGYTPLIPVLIEHDWLSASDAAYLGATNLAGYVAGSLLAASLARIVPVARMTRAAMAVTAFSLVACALPWGFVWFVPWRFLAGFTGGLIMVGAIPLVLSRVQAEHRGRANGIIFTGVGLGIISSGTLVPALAAFGPAPIWLALAAAAALLTILTWPQWAEEPPRPAPQNDAPPRAFSLPVALFLAAYILDAAGFVPHTVFWADYIARGLGHGAATGAFFWIFFGFGALIGPFLAGILAERFSFYRSMVALLGVKAAAVAIPLLSQHSLALAASAMIVGALTPGISALASGRVAELAGHTAHRQVWGWMTGGWAISSAAVGYLLSFLFDRTGSYDLLFAFGAAGLTLAMLFSAFARK